MSVTIDRSFDVPIYSPQCLRCKHYRPNADGAGRQCTAFPEADSIPLSIWKAETLHDQPYPGDQGIQFEPLPGTSLADVRPRQ